MKSFIRLVDKLVIAQAAGFAAWARRRRMMGASAGAAVPRVPVLMDASPSAAVPRVPVLMDAGPSAAAPRVPLRSAARVGSSWAAIKLAGMGDAVLMLPALEAMRRAAGDRLVVVTTPRCAGVFSAPGVADEVIVVGPGSFWRGLKAARAALRDCDGVLDFEQHVFYSGAVALLAGRRARLHGFQTTSRRRTRIYDVVVDPGAAPRPMKEIFDDLARSAGFHPAPGLRALPVRPSATAAVEAWLKQQGLERGRYAVIAPGSGATVAFRRLAAPVWAEMIGALPRELGVVMTGTAVEAELLAEIERESKRRLVTLIGAGPSAAAPRAPLGTGQGFGLEELASLLAGAERVVAIDSGPMHLAAAMGCAVVGIFGPDTPRRYGPYNGRSRSVTLELACSPCNNCFVYREARCSNPDRYACLRRMPTALLTDAVASNASGRGAPAKGAHN